MSRKKKTPVQQALVELRKRTGHTQATMAAVLNVQLPSVGRWETTEPPTNIALARLWDVANENGHRDLGAVFYAELEEMKKRQAIKAADIFDEMKRWRDINDHLKGFGEEAERLREENLKDADIPQRIVDRLYALEKVLAAAQRWSWTNR